MITVNINKAKNIGHEMRRQKRAEDFKPFDQAIAAQIPGQMEGAEAQRVLIRSKYDTMQTQIDAATTAEEIKQALGI